MGIVDKSGVTNEQWWELSNADCFGEVGYGRVMVWRDQSFCAGHKNWCSGESKREKVSTIQTIHDLFYFRRHKKKKTFYNLLFFPKHPINASFTKIVRI